MAGILERLQERNRALQELRDNSPEAYAEKIGGSFNRTLSAFGSKQTRLAETQANSDKKLSAELSIQGEQSQQNQRLNLIRDQRLEMQGRSQLDATQALTDTTELGTQKVTSVLGDVVLELKRGFKDLRNTMQSSGSSFDLPGGPSGRPKGVLNDVKNIGAGIAGSYAAGMAVNNASVLFDSKASGADKATAGAHLVTSAAGAGIGGILGSLSGFGPVQGAAFGAAVGETLATAGDKLGQAIAGSGLGDAVGMAAAAVMSPFSEDAREALSLSYKNTILPALTQSFGPVVGAIGNFRTDVAKTVEEFRKDTTATISVLNSTGTSVVQGVTDAASTAWGGLKRAAVQVAAGNIPAAVRTVKTAGSAAYGSLKEGAQVARGLAVGRYNSDEAASIESLTAKGERFKGGKGLTADTKALISDTAQKYGVDPQTMLTMAQIESGGNTNAVSSTGAAGLYQFTGGTAKQYGIKNRFDAKQNTEAAAKFMSDNAAGLRKRGIEPTAENLYLAHQQGVGGATEILRAATGKGTLSAKTAENMRLNYGAMTPQEYVAANKKKVDAASVQAQTTTYAGKYNESTPGAAVTKTAVAGTPTGAPRPATAPSVAATTVVDKGAPKGKEAPGTKQAPVYVARSTPEAPSAAARVTTPLPMGGSSAASGREARYASASIAPIPQLNPRTPPEVANVSVVNQPPAPEKQAASGGGTQRVARLQGVPDLGEIPPFFPDLSLASIMLGRV